MHPSTLEYSEDWKSYIYVAANIDGGVSLIYPCPDYPGTKEDWIRRHDLDLAEQYIELHPMQVPASRKHREFWKIQDGKLIVELPDDFKDKFEDYEEQTAIGI